MINSDREGGQPIIVAVGIETSAKLRDLLIVAQVAISLVLLVGAALLTRTQYHVLGEGQSDHARHALSAFLDRRI